MITGRQGLLENGHCSSICQGSRTFRDYGLDGAADAAAESARAAVPFEDYWQDGAADDAAGPMIATAPPSHWDRQTYNAGYIHMEVEALRSWLAARGNEAD